MSSDEILKILITFDDFLKLANLGADIGRNILFGIARFFLWIVQNLENIMTEMLTFLGFYNDSSLKGEGGLLQTLISFNINVREILSNKRYSYECTYVVADVFNASNNYE